jgi:OOP family OmpA-OmpF porin
MKKFLVLISFCILSICADAQNLVLNPGLENYIACPGFGQFGPAYINDWSKPSIASTDYYNVNCAGIQPTQQTPHGGDAYFGIIAYNYTGEYREYATGRLSSPLLAGVPYSVSFYVSLNDGYIQAINEMGAYFSASAPGPFGNALHIAATPQVENTSGMLSSTTSWMLISGSFIASGGEQYITIGNFHDDASTTITQVGNVGSYGGYYFVDDISVKAELTGLELYHSTEILTWPDPFKNELHFNLGSLNSGELILRDVSAHIVLQQDIENAAWLNTSSLASGLYLYEIRTKGTIVAKGKLVKD